jgi:hypothetical protein
MPLKFNVPRIDVSKVVLSVREKFGRLNKPQKAFIVLALVCAILTVGLAVCLMKKGDGFSKLIINPAYARDNFQVQATKSDSIGVENATEFLIKSKDSIDPQLLKENLALDPGIPYNLDKIDDHNFRMTPKSPLENKRIYNVQIASAYMGADGNKAERDYSWAFQVKDQFKVLQTLPRDKATDVPLDTGIEITFSQDNFVNYENAVKIEPQVSGKFEKHGRTLVFVPNELKEGTIYTVTVSKDLELQGSANRLDGDYVFRFETSSAGSERGLSDSFDFEKQFSEFSSKNKPVFGINEYNMYLTELPVDVYSFKDEQQFLGALKARADIPYWANYTRGAYLQNVSDLNKVASIKLPVSTYTSQEFITLPNALPRGYYMIQTQAKGMVRQTYFQISDLSVYTNVTTTSTLVWANDLNTKNPVAGADIENLDTGGKAVTGDNGIATLDTVSFFGLKDGDYKDTYIKVSKDGFATIIPLSISYYNANASANNSLWYYFYTDRSLYKPSDTINFWGFARERNGSDTGEEMTVRLTMNDWYDYYYEPIVISETKAQIKNGSIVGKMDLQNLTPGYYSMEFMLGDKVVSTQYITIQSYTKPAYDIEVAPEKYAVFAGEDIVLNVKAKFFEGTPVPGLELSYMADGDSSSNTVTTDGFGNAQVKIPTSYDCSEPNCDYPLYNHIVFNPAKSEEGEIFGDAQVRVFGPKITTAVEISPANNNTEKIITTVNKINLDKINKGDESFYGDSTGDPAAGISLNAKIIEISYDKVETGTHYDFINKIVQKEYRYDEVKKTIGTFSGVTDNSGKFEHDFNASPDKNYEADIVADDGSGRKDEATQYFYASGNYMSDGYESDYNYYSLNLKDKNRKDGTDFSVGEQVDLDFLNNDQLLPQSGKGNFLYLQMQEGLTSYNLSDKPEYSFQFEEKNIPNIYVQGVWFDGTTYRESGSNQWGSSSATMIGFKKSDRQLNISLKADKDKYQPGDQVVLNAQVTDAKGNPVQTNLNLNLVDEAFYELSQESVDTLNSLYSVNLDAGQLTSYASHETPGNVSSGAERGGCFLAGTKIKMADGGYKNIENVKKGDEIMTFENEFTKKLVPAKVQETFQHRVLDYLIINGSLKITPQHRVFVNNGWEIIGQAKVGDYLVNEKGDRVKIASIEHKQELVSVYNLEIEKYHTFLADGIYVHNDKGGGRENFVDNALFSSVDTGADGKAQVKFTLPDNITSWRVTAQAINNQLFAGSNTAKIVVSLPVFVTETMADEYLSSDKPVIKLNSFGEMLKAGDMINYHLEIPTLGINGWSAAGKAFEPQYVQIPGLAAGNHRVTASVDFGKAQDKMTRSISVIDSRLKEQDQKFYDLAQGLKIEGGSSGQTKLVFTDKERGQFYLMLSYLGWTYGDRVDQKLSRIVAQDLKKKYFQDDESTTEDFDGGVYQLPDGGISLLPYSDEDIELSAEVALVASDRFDKESLKNYFYTVYTDQKSTGEQVGAALLGLASLGEPVLVPLQHFAAISELSPKTRLYAALALYQLGDKETAYGIYTDLMNKFAEHLNPYVRLKVSDNQDEVLKDTSLAAVLAAGLGDEYRDNLWKYASENNGKDILTNLDQLMYVSAALPEMKAGPTNFTVQVGDHKEDVSLKDGSSHEILLNPDQLDKISFSNINGRVGVTSIYNTASSQNKTSPYVSVQRTYDVNGSMTNSFKENDLVEVVLTPQISQSSPDNDYQLTDILPSGLKAVVNPYDRNGAYSDPCVRYPFEIDGQSVKFYLGKNWLYSGTCANTYKYYARVVSLGDYAAEPAVIQSMRTPEIKNYSNSGQVTIGKQ